MDIDNKVKYINYSICEFAASHNMALLEAYDYLSEHGAVAFLDECYEAEHLLSIEEAVADILSETRIAYRLPSPPSSPSGRMTTEDEIISKRRIFDLRCQTR